ncbi:transposable element Tc1 transposase [Trichonephila clavipes]|nr:transposable element Tc1 transposase [Trichonephila clavipes]
MVSTRACSDGVACVWRANNEKLAVMCSCCMLFRYSRLLACQEDPEPSLRVTNLFLSTGLSAYSEKTTRRKDRRIERQALVDPTVTRSTKRAEVGVAIFPQTISRHLSEANVKYKRPFRALLLTLEHRQQRLQWCQARSMWNVTDWQKVMFSDESRFVLGTDDNRVRVLRRPGERYNSPTLFYVTLPAQLV